MTARAVQQAWKGISDARVATVGRTHWVSGGGYWLAHASRVPTPTRVTVTAVKNHADIRDAITRTTAHARPGWATVPGDWHGVDRTPLAAVTHYGDHRRPPDDMPVLLGFNLAWFTGLSTLLDRCQRRIDAQRIAVSWWAPQGYPVAVLLGVRSRPRAAS